MRLMNEKHEKCVYKIGTGDLRDRIYLNVKSEIKE